MQEHLVEREQVANYWISRPTRVAENNLGYVLPDLEFSGGL